MDVAVTATLSCTVKFQDHLVNSHDSFFRNNFVSLLAIG